MHWREEKAKKGLEAATGRVTGWGEFSPLGPFFYLGQIFRKL
jgi:hypothetical protein